MRDLVFIALVVGFFVLAALFVAGCERIVGRTAVDDQRTMSLEDAVGLVLVRRRARLPRLRTARSREARMTPAQESAVLMVFGIGLGVGFLAYLVLDLSVTGDT